MKILKGFYKGVELAVPEDGSVRPTVDHFKKHILRIFEKTLREDSPQSCFLSGSERHDELPLHRASKLRSSRPSQSIYTLHCWDLFAGSGGVGLEFLSAGASEVVFVEERSRAVACLNLNIAQCRLKNAEVFKMQKPVVVQSSVQKFLENPILAISKSNETETKIVGAPKNHNDLITPSHVDVIFLDPPYGQGFLQKTVPLILRCPLVTPSTLIVIEHATDESLSDIKFDDVNSPERDNPHELNPASLTEGLSYFGGFELSNQGEFECTQEIYGPKTLSLVRKV